MWGCSNDLVPQYCSYNTWSVFTKLSSNFWISPVIPVSKQASVPKEVFSIWGTHGMLSPFTWMNNTPLLRRQVKVFFFPSGRKRNLIFQICTRVSIYEESQIWGLTLTVKPTLTHISLNYWLKFLFYLFPRRSDLRRQSQKKAWTDNHHRLRPTDTLSTACVSLWHCWAPEIPSVLSKKLLRRPK